MPKLPKNTLKTFFEKNDIPTEIQFASFIDSTLNLIDDRKLLGLREYDPTVVYTVGDTALYSSMVYQALFPTTGPFDATKWKKLTFGAVNYVGTWDASTNVNPTLASGIGNKGDYYVVRVGGTTDIDGTDEWNEHDWIVFNGTKWEKVDAVDDQPALDVSYDNTVSGMLATNVQDAIDELHTHIDTAETDIDTLQVTKADKLPSAVSGNFIVFDNTGNLADSNFDPTDYLDKNNNTVYVPVNDYNPATKKYVDDLTASDISVTPAGGISATDVQSALEELDADKETANPNIQAHIADMSNPHNVTKTQVGLGNVENLKVNLAATINPGLTNDNTQGYAAGSRWLNVLLNKEFVCLNAAAGAAIWKHTTAVTATEIAFTPAGGISATDVQTAIQELDADKEPANPNIQAHIANMSNPHNVTKTQVGLGNVENLKVNLTASTDPGVSNDLLQGYAAGSRWINTSSNKEFVCLSPAIGAAVWKHTTAITGGDVGLGNVTNDQQLSQKEFTASEGSSTNSTTGFINKLSHTFTITVTSNYLVEWYLELGHSNNNGVSESEVRLDTITQLGLNQTQFINGGAFTSVGGFYLANFSASSSHTVDINFRKVSGAGNALTQRARIKVTKI